MSAINTLANPNEALKVWGEGGSNLIELLDGITEPPVGRFTLLEYPNKNTPNEEELIEFYYTISLFPGFEWNEEWISYLSDALMDSLEKESLRGMLHNFIVLPYHRGDVMLNRRSHLGYYSEGLHYCSSADALASLLGRIYVRHGVQEAYDALLDAAMTGLNSDWFTESVSESSLQREFESLRNMRETQAEKRFGLLDTKSANWIVGFDDKFALTEQAIKARPRRGVGLLMYTNGLDRERVTAYPNATSLGYFQGVTRSAGTRYEEGAYMRHVRRCALFMVAHLPELWGVDAQTTLKVIKNEPSLSDPQRFLERHEHLLIVAAKRHLSGVADFIGEPVCCDALQSAITA